MTPSSPPGDGGEPDSAGAPLAREELEAWGRRLGAAAARSGVFVALFGPLGSGKSTLARAAARGAGVERAVPSPTYTLVNEHPIPGESGGGTFFHVDLYRLGGDAAPGSGDGAGRALDEIGWQRLLSADGPVFVEWAQRAAGAIPPDRWEVRLGIPGDRSLRTVSVRRVGDAPPPPRPDAGREERRRPRGTAGDRSGSC